jgi:hypothetical protein
LEPLYVLAVSAKRYALFNLDAKGRPIIRKASAHGLGHLVAPYGDDAETHGIPKPAVPVGQRAADTIGVHRWQHDVWYQILTAAIEGHPDQVRLIGAAWDQPAVSRYGATTPAILRWFEKYNRDRPYGEQVRPFGFLLAFQADSVGSRPLPDDAANGEALAAWQDLRTWLLAEGGVRPTRTYPARVIPRSVLRREGKTPGQLASSAGFGSADKFMHDLTATYVAAKAARQRPKVTRPRPVAAFDQDPRHAAMMAFDRETGEPVTGGLETYRQALASYHLRPEEKFLGGEYLDRGLTVRRHVVVETIEYIGKEANRWEEQFYLGEDEEAQVEYGTDPASVERMRGTALRTVQTFKQGRVAKAAGLSLRDVGALAKEGKATPEALEKICRAAEALRREDEDRRRKAEDIIRRVKAVCVGMSVRRFANVVNVDHANLVRVLAGKNQVGPKMLEKLEAALEGITKAARTV